MPASTTIIEPVIEREKLEDKKRTEFAISSCVGKIPRADLSKKYFFNFVKK